MPLSAARWSITANLINQESTVVGCCAFSAPGAVDGMVLP
jgi:hypothetical protein